MTRLLLVLLLLSGLCYGQAWMQDPPMDTTGYTNTHLWGYLLPAALCADEQVLRWDTTLTKWECATPYSCPTCAETDQNETITGDWTFNDGIYFPNAPYTVSLTPGYAPFTRALQLKFSSGLTSNFGGLILADLLLEGSADGAIIYHAFDDVGGNPFDFGIYAPRPASIVHGLNFYLPADISASDPQVLIGEAAVGDPTQVTLSFGDYTLAGVTANGNATTTNIDALGLIARGDALHAGQLALYDAGAVHSASIAPGAAMTTSPVFYLPDAPPASTQFLTMTSGGAMGFDASTYLTAEVDGVIGNEVTNTTDTTLTRSGTGTGVSPFTLGLNLGNANTWTAQQSSPNPVDTKKFNPDTPPASANAADDEFDDATIPAGKWSWHDGAGPSTISEATTGYLILSNTADSTDYLKQSVNYAAEFSIETSVHDLFSGMSMEVGAATYLFAVDVNGTGHAFGFYVASASVPQVQLYKCTIATWGAPACGLAGWTYYFGNSFGRARIARSAANAITMYVSDEGLAWRQMDGGSYAGVVAEIRYIGIYNTFKDGGAANLNSVHVIDYFRKTP